MCEDALSTINNIIGIIGFIISIVTLIKTKKIESAISNVRIKDQYRKNRKNLIVQISELQEDINSKSKSDEIIIQKTCKISSSINEYKRIFDKDDRSEINKFNRKKFIIEDDISLSDEYKFVISRFLQILLTILEKERYYI